MHRILRFRNELMILWRAFMAPATPLWLKGLMLIVPLYLLSPIDLIPDFIPLAGWLDDIIIVPLLGSWLVGVVPRATSGRSWTSGATRDPDGTVIDGTARRL